jgi:hypothetical protein
VTIECNNKKICDVKKIEPPIVFNTKNVKYDLYENHQKRSHDINQLKIENLNMNYMFHASNESLLENTKKFTIANANLISLNKEDLKVFRNLEILNVSRNPIEYLEKGLFENNAKVKEIYLNENNIKYIHPKVFVELSNLNILNLQKNLCINEYYGSQNDIKGTMKTIISKCLNFEFELEIQVEKINEILQQQVQTLQNHTKLIDFCTKSIDEIRASLCNITCCNSTTTIMVNDSSCSDLNVSLTKFERNLLEMKNQIELFKPNENNEHDEENLELIDIRSKQQLMFLVNISQGFILILILLFIICGNNQKPQIRNNYELTNRPESYYDNKMMSQSTPTIDTNLEMRSFNHSQQGNDLNESDLYEEVCNFSTATTSGNELPGN